MDKRQAAIIKARASMATIFMHCLSQEQCVDANHILDKLLTLVGGDSYRRGFAAGKKAKK